MNEKAKGILRKVASVACIVYVWLELFRSLAMGFRWPSDYVLTNHVITYIYGFMPRSLVGAVGHLIFGDKWYCWKYMSLVIMSVAAIFVLWVFAKIVIAAWDGNDIPTFAILGTFAISPYAKYFLHEMGYYEQYGFVMIIILYYVMKKRNIVTVYVIPAIFSAIMLLVSETNAFLTMPTVFVFSFLILVNDDGIAFKGQKLATLKKLAVLVASYIPHVAYCFFMSTYKVSSDTISELQAHDYWMSQLFPDNFAFNEGVHWYLAGDRTNEEYWGREWHAIPAWYVLMPLLIVVFVLAVMNYMHLSKKLMISYAVSAVAVAFAAYVINIIAWDLHRYFFCMYMAVFFVSLFTIKRLMPKVPCNSTIIFYALMLFLAFGGMAARRLDMFDNEWYSQNWSEVLAQWHKRL